ncbi:quinolinate synthase NadA [Curvivirga aplysinae]|uniref:quinolinate synthase NadA n=1 Tax=Curvivirga aplysinae TaxID=2529852 RepID=UPI0012BCBD23|nr:quinolinate synthase NadA [Curvivirga aplysinae]MTI10805.1 quinolinate synthase NadA [Curvivirga aplysinae]
MLDQVGTPELDLELSNIRERVKSVINDDEWDFYKSDIEDVLRLKKEKNAIILGHNYMTPDIFHCVSDITGDSLALAKRAMDVDADIIVVAGVHFMAETAKLMNPEKTVLISDPTAGCSLAESITADDIRKMRALHPGVPVVTYVNTTVEVKAESDICCTSANAKQIVESLGVEKVMLFPDEFLAQNVAEQTDVEIITFPGRCEVHERFTGQQIKLLKKAHPDATVLAHPECPPEVLHESDYAGSTADMSRFVEEQKPKEVALITECSMSANLVAEHPETNFIRSCNLCPHMQKITMENIATALRDMTTEITIDPALAAKARQAVERMIAVPLNK